MVNCKGTSVAKNDKTRHYLHFLRCFDALASKPWQKGTQSGVISIWLGNDPRSLKQFVQWDRDIRDWYLSPKLDVFVSSVERETDAKRTNAFLNVQ